MRYATTLPTQTPNTTSGVVAHQSPPSASRAACSSMICCSLSPWQARLAKTTTAAERAPIETAAAETNAHTSKLACQRQSLHGIRSQAASVAHCLGRVGDKPPAAYMSRLPVPKDGPVEYSLCFGSDSSCSLFAASYRFGELLLSLSVT